MGSAKFPTRVMPDQRPRGKILRQPAYTPTTSESQMDNLEVSPSIDSVSQLPVARPSVATVAKSEAYAPGGMVATKDWHATRAGIEILEQGGNAVDAAVAAGFAVGVVEPMSSGLGGGGYLVYQVGDRGGVIGFPMKAPLSAEPGMYELTGQAAVGDFGWPGVLNDENLDGPRSIAVPGAVAGLCKAQELLGNLPLAEVIAPAVRLAREGHLPRWHNLHALGMSAPRLLAFEGLRRAFMPGGKLPATDIANPSPFIQPELADVLESIGREGPDAFYTGDIAKAIVDDISSNGGILCGRDLAEYRPMIWERGLEFAYAGHTVRVPPLACAGTTTAMTLRLLSGFDVESFEHNSADALHAFISGARLAYADRYAHMADPAFVDCPWQGLLADGYIDQRRGLISQSEIGAIGPGDPWAFQDTQPREKLPASLPALDSGTTHLCVMDAAGNAVSLTNTLMASFGSGFVPQGTGVVMNNGMMWFDPVPGRINSIMPGKYALNNMTPALVMGPDGVRLAVGASGGRRITNCVSQLISKILDFGMGPQAAIDSPRVDCSLPATSVDPRIPVRVIDELRSRGHRIEVVSDRGLASGNVSFASPVAIVRDPGTGFRAGVDTFHSAHAEGL